MRANSLYAKKSKCYFVVTKVEYLGHFIYKDGVFTDPTKIEVVKQYPLPQTLKQPRSFLGLAGYYRRFVSKYGSVVKPLTNMLKKDNFCWIAQAKEAFLQLKQQLIQAPILALPKFSKEFVVEVDASGQGIGVVLM
uniref:Retrovirus-related Pol polyprotein from transposon 297 family n=1 Tax=Cajanus cajan TaxID=3821 RepID=A0A151U498_CAJCA|nr:Retrovirus-related Pol polyprotein from transposon 297 family [Cajanus cajan]